MRTFAAEGGRPRWWADWWLTVSDLEEPGALSEFECRTLLQRERLARVAVSVGALPAVFPVSYVLAGCEILFLTGDRSRLGAATRNAVVAFEVDHYEPSLEDGWSVTAVGVTTAKTDPESMATARALGLTPWLAGDPSHLVGLTPELLSGRRVGSPRRTVAGDDGSAAWMVGPRSTVARLVRPPVRAGWDWNLGDVAHALRRAGVSAALVGDQDAIVTERDLTRALNAGLGPHDAVSTVTVGHAWTVDDRMSVVDAAAEMLSHDVRHLVVRDGHRDILGVVSLRDVLRVLLDAMDPTVWVSLHQTLSLSWPGPDG